MSEKHPEGHEGKKKAPASLPRRIWKFLWEDDSIWSWLANIALAFILIKFIIFPGLGFILGTNYPIVAVVSGSMEHDSNFDDWWHTQETQYQKFGISRKDFERYPLRDGFNKGDIIVLLGAKKDTLKVGEVVVFAAQNTKTKPDPIIHRVISIDRSGTDPVVQTKGDHNTVQIRNNDIDETNIKWNQVVGKAWLRVPMLGYIKIWFVDLINLFRR